MAQAIVVNMRRRGPGQMLGLSLPSGAEVLDTITSGEYSSRISQLDRLELLLKVSIAASCVAGLAGLMVLFRRS